MKQHKSVAIVLHTHLARDRDKLVVFITPDRGKLKGWAYGARGMRNRFGAALEPMAKIEVRFLEKESEETVRIESVELIRSLFPAQQNLRQSFAASYIAETIDVFVQQDEPAELTFRLADHLGEGLLAGADPVALVAYSEIWALRIAGILPSPRSCSVCDRPLTEVLLYEPEHGAFVCPDCETGESEAVIGRTGELLRAALGQPVERFASVYANDAAIDDLRTFARRIRRNFLGHELKSYDMLQSVLR